MKRTTAFLGFLAALAAANLHAHALPPYVPRPEHVVVVVMENEGWGAVIGNPAAPYINSLAAAGANFSQAYAVTHPSQPNYIALFSGATQGVADDTCPRDFLGVPNLGSQMIAAGFSFVGYSEDLPSTGYTGCSVANYRRRHNPWVNFDGVPGSSNRPFSDFPADYSALPTLSFVVPNLCNDMHDCPIATGDAWLSSHIDGYAQWAGSHASLLIVLWDEDDYSGSNRIPVIFAGAAVQPGTYAETFNHYGTLRTLEDMFGLAPLGNAAAATPIVDIWNDRIFGEDFD